MSITVEQIEQNIVEYQERISKAQDQLAVLPEGYLPYQDHKRREKIRRECQADIKHIKGLIQYANEGIQIRKQNGG